MRLSARLQVTVLLVAWALCAGVGIADAAEGRGKLRAALDRLKSEDVAERRAAAQEVREQIAKPKLWALFGIKREVPLGPHLDEISDLIRDRDEDSEVRSSLVDALAEAGASARDAQTALIAVLRDETDDSGVRSSVAVALPEVGEGEDVKNAILGALRSSSVEVRMNAFQQLHGIGLDRETLLDQVERAMRDPVLRSLAIDYAFQFAEVDDRALGFVIQGLRDPDPDIRLSTARHIQAERLGTTRIVPELEKLVRADDGKTRVAAAAALASLRGDVAKYEPVFEQAMADSQPDVRAESALAIGMLEARAKDMLPLLENAVDDPSPRVRVQVAYAMARVSGDAGPSIRPLFDAAASSDEEVVAWASSFLALLVADPALGPSAKSEAQPLVLEMVKDKAPDVRARAISLLPSLHSDASFVLEIIEESLEDESAAVRRAALLGMTFMGQKARRLLPQVRKLLEDDDEEVREAARFVMEAVSREC